MRATAISLSGGKARWDALLSANHLCLIFPVVWYSLWVLFFLFLIFSAFFNPLRIAIIRCNARNTTPSLATVLSFSVVIGMSGRSHRYWKKVLDVSLTGMRYYRVSFLAVIFTKVASDFRNCEFRNFGKHTFCRQKMSHKTTPTSMLTKDKTTKHHQPQCQLQRRKECSTTTKVLKMKNRFEITCLVLLHRRKWWTRKESSRICLICCYNYYY